MSAIEKKLMRRQRSHYQVRKKVFGTGERPRLSVCRTSKHIYAQVIDDLQGKTLCAVSTMLPEFRKNAKQCGNVKSARAVGKKLAELAQAKGIKTVIFDRGCFMYHGRIKALAEEARKAGLQF